MKRLIIILLIFILNGCFLLEKPEEEIVDNENKLPTQVEVPFKTKGDSLAVWDYSEKIYKKVFIKGINLGVGVPGTQAGNLAPDYSTYYRWFQDIKDMGANNIRIYTLHYPRFYRALNDFNEDNSGDPLYLFQGIWLDEEYFEDNQEYTLYDLSEQSFKQEIEDVIDCAYGNKTINDRDGKASGDYTIDISRWIMGWIVGREIFPNEIERTNNLDKTVDHNGSLFSIKNAKNISTKWAVEFIDYTAAYEKNNYNHERPVSMSSWPTLDPLNHASENGKEDSQAFYLEDINTQNSKAGYFATYHAYPYYPDFMYYGENDSYSEYIRRLKEYYSDKEIPLVIGETGVPSSWGNAKFGDESGDIPMNHGGYNEEKQGEVDVLIIDEIYNSGCGGVIIFAWIDEWWKRAWINDSLTFPRNRYRYWHDITNPEENFGMVKYLPSENEYKIIYSKEDEDIIEVKAMANETFFNAKIEFSGKIAEENKIEIGFDTYGDILGKKVFVDGITSGELGLEFVLEYPGESSNSAQLYVSEAYDLYGVWHNLDRNLEDKNENRPFRSTESDNGNWLPVKWLNFFRGGVGKDYNIGELGVSYEKNNEGSKIAVFINNNIVEIKIPWTVLQFSDPSLRQVIDGGEIKNEQIELKSITSSGIALSVYTNGKIIKTDRYIWNTWGENEMYEKYVNNENKEKKKASYYKVKEAFEGK